MSLLPTPATEATGRDTGIDDLALGYQRAVIDADRTRIAGRTDPVDLLADREP